MHNIIIGLLIIAIVSLQILVFRVTKRKIELYKSIIPEQKSFKTVKVYIPESQIETVKLKDLYMNIDRYSLKNVLGEDSFDTPIMKEPFENNTNHLRSNEFEILVPNIVKPDRLKELRKNIAEGKKPFVSVKKDNDKRVIDSVDLENFLSRGWEVNY